MSTTNNTTTPPTTDTMTTAPTASTAPTTTDMCGNSIGTTPNQGGQGISIRGILSKTKNKLKGVTYKVRGLVRSVFRRKNSGSYKNNKSSKKKKSVNKNKTNKTFKNKRR